MAAVPTNGMGRYEILREIARSNDIVYEGWDPQTQRRVAIKTLHIPSGATDSQRADRIARFNREARATARLHHPNIVTLFDFGEEDGQPYLVFEYIDGPTLADVLLQKGPFSPTLATEYSFQLLSALEYAHIKGVIHRDIKPSNLFICEGDKLMVADLGIARIETEATVTTDGQVFGTPAYMAPEQVRGKDLDKRVDIWACGVVLFQMVTGVQPFTGGSVIEIGSNVLNSEPNLILVADSRIRRVVKQALSKEPAYRYPTAAAMIRGLCSSTAPPVSSADPVPAPVAPAAQIGQVTVAMPPVGKASKTFRPILVWSTSCLAAAAAGGALVALYMRPNSPAAPSNSATTQSSTNAPKTLDQVIAEALRKQSLDDLVTSDEFRRLPEGAQEDELDTWGREAIARDYLALNPNGRTNFLHNLIDRFGNVSNSFPAREASVRRGNVASSPSRNSDWAQTFDIGSSEQTVEHVQGQPDSILYRPGLTELHYGPSIVYVRNGRVAYYVDNGNLRIATRVVDDFVVPPIESTITSPIPPPAKTATPPRPATAPTPPLASDSTQSTAPPPPERHIYPDQQSTDLNDLEVLKRLGFQPPFSVRILPGGVREYTNSTGVVRIR